MSSISLVSSPIEARLPQHGQLFALDIDQGLDPRQVSRQSAQIAPAYSWRPRRIAAPRSGFRSALGGRRGLLEVLQAELHDRGRASRAPAELPALQLPDQEPQLLDLGLCRVTLGQSSIVLGL